MEARFKVGDLIGLPVRLPDGLGWDGNGKMKIALVTNVFEWRRPRTRFELEDPLTWDYTALTADGKEINFSDEHFLCFAAKLLEAA